MKNTTVLISGASIAGPALAHWLTRYGCGVTVVERAPALRTGGQAVDFKGETHRTVLERMGILDDVRAHATGGRDVAIVDADGRTRAVIPGTFTGGDIEIRRGDLSRLLYERTAGGDHAAAFARYDELFRRYSTVSRKGNAGPFLAPPSRLRIAMRDRMFRSTRLLAMMMKMTDSFATDIELTDYACYEARYGS